MMLPIRVEPQNPDWDVDQMLRVSPTNNRPPFHMLRGDELLKIAINTERRMSTQQEAKGSTNSETLNTEDSITQSAQHSIRNDSIKVVRLLIFNSKEFRNE
jgi:hypothetical protein